MSRTIDRFNTPQNSYDKATTVNYEDHPSFTRGDEEAYLQVLLTNTLTGTYYASESDLLSESLALHAAMTKEQPQFAAQAIVYARNEGFMRLQPIVGLAYLAKTNRDRFKAIFPLVIKTPGDLADFVEIVRGNVTPGGMGRMIKTVVGNWLNNMSEYHAIKYATGGQGYSLRDILRLTHPKPKDEKQKQIFLWLTDREKWLATESGQCEQIAAFEALKREDYRFDSNEQTQLIERGKLPHEIVTGVIKPDKITWAYIMRQMPYFALLRNLNTLQRADVFTDEANVAYAVERLTDGAAIKKAMILPFRLHAAWIMFKPQQVGEQLVKDALVDALELSFTNVPAIGHKVCIAPDVSGSMGGYISGRSAVRCIDIAGIFSGALLKANPAALVLPFESHVVDVALSSRDSIMTNAAKIALLGGGGTAISAPISELHHRRVPVDTFVGITDSIEWATDRWGGFLPVWREYKRTIAPHAKAFLVTIAPYRYAVAPAEEKDVFYIYGWNDNVLNYIAMHSNGMANQVEIVKSRAIQPPTA